MTEKYSFYVSAARPDDVEGPPREAKYNGDQAADAMAAWSEAVSEGNEYAVLEALRERPK